jgi:flagellar motility protein MotE (MotC chaperone)
MKFLFLVFCFLVLNFSNAQDKSQAKSYTEEEFLKKVNDEVKIKVDLIKNKNISELTKEILDRENQLRIRELELQKKTDALKVSEDDLSKRYLEFQEKQKSFIACIDKNNEEVSNRISQLVDMVSNMKPQKAAEVLSVQDQEVAVQIIQAIDSKKASKIFNFMDKEISAKLQKQYLEMKKQ